MEVEMVANPKIERVDYEQYISFAEQPENADRIFELIDGEIVEKMPSLTPSQVSSFIAHLLWTFLRENPIGWVSGEAGGYKMPDGDVLNPDVGFISKVRLPNRPRREAPIPPDFAIEVKSPSDRKRAMRRKAEKYLMGGTRLVWLVFPDERIIEVYDLQAEDVQTVGMDDTLSGSDVLPGFAVKVADIFAVLDE